MDTAEKVRALSEQFNVNPLDARSMLRAFGLFGVYAILFAETGLLIGFFLPGDSLLFLAGVAATGVADQVVGTRLPLGWLLVGAPVCAIAGAQLGHYLGARFGAKFFDRPNSRLFKREYVEKAEHYFEKFGPAKAVILARFIPIVRTFLNPVAGVLEMPARTFFVWNVIGGVLWTDGLILAGYLIGDAIPADLMERYIYVVIVLIILLSLLPIFIEIYRDRRAKRARRQRDEIAETSV